MERDWNALRQEFLLRRKAEWSDEMQQEWEKHRADLVGEGWTREEWERRREHTLGAAFDHEWERERERLEQGDDSAQWE